MTESHVKPPLPPEEKPTPPLLLAALRPFVAIWGVLRRVAGSLQAAWVIALFLGLMLFITRFAWPLPQALLAGTSPTTTCQAGDWEFVGAINQPMMRADRELRTDPVDPTVTVSARFNELTGHPVTVTIETSKNTVDLVYTYAKGDRTIPRWVTPQGEPRVQLRDDLTLLNADTKVVVCVSPGTPR